MKQKFSTKWKASKQPRKQRKYRVNAPLHLKRKMLSVNLTKELREKHGIRNIPIRKGDEVKVMRGKFKKRGGKIQSINLKNLKISVDGLQKDKSDGTKVPVWFEPSNLQIHLLNLDDIKRLKRKVKDLEKGDKEKTKSETKKQGEKNAPKKK